MSDGRKPKLKEQNADLPRMKVELKEEPPLTAEQLYLKRKAEVTQQDNEDFSEYLRKKAARDEQQPTQPASTAQPAPARRGASSRFNRRSLLTWAAGTAVVGEAVTLGYPMLTGQSIPDHGARHAGATSTDPQRHPIDRELVNPQADVGGRRFGDWVLLMPTKMSGGTYAVNLNTGRALAWVSYWNYGDFNPISHHLCAFPSADPAKGFEWINSTQGARIRCSTAFPPASRAPMKASTFIACATTARRWR
jgi:thiocyanate desulfurase